MAKKDLKEELEIPEGITARKEPKLFIIKGPKGEVEKKFTHPNVQISVEGNKITLESKKATKREKAVIKAYAAHIRNAFSGVTNGHQYKLVICSGHFPMTVAFSNGTLTIKNFFGERVPRVVEIDKRISVKVQGKEILVEGVDKELVGDAAARIELKTRRPGFDRRIFQDGIYLVERDGQKI